MNGRRLRGTSSTPARLAIEAVARHLSATWQARAGRSKAALRVAGRRIAIEVSVLPAPRGPVAARPRLRFDRVVLEVMGRLQQSLSDVVPARKVVVVTMTAPIRLASKTTAELEAEIRTLIARRAAEARFSARIHENRIQVRVMKAAAAASRFIGFVHNADSDPNVIFAVTRSLLRSIGPKAGVRPRGSTGRDRWLVIAGEDNAALADTYRKVLAQLFVSTGFDKVLMVTQGRVEVLAGRMCPAAP